MTPNARLLSITTPKDDSGVIEHPLDIIEFAGRVDYGQKSLSRMGERDIIGRWIDSGHESMLEMVDATFLITCSRVVSHELVRHRLASYQQESQRYVDYADEFIEDLFVMPEEVLGDEEAEEMMWDAYRHSQRVYERLREHGVSRQIARYVLPSATRTRIIVKANLREWRHILQLRLHTSAQPEMREVMSQILPILQDNFGTTLFPNDIAGKRAVR